MKFISFAMEHKDKIEPLINLLKNAKPMKGRAIAYILNISERELRAVVNNIRTNVTPRITSGDFGYTWETDIEKIRRSIARLKAHSFSQIRVANNQEKLLREEIK